MFASNFDSIGAQQEMCKKIQSRGQELSAGLFQSVCVLIKFQSATRPYKTNIETP